MADSQRRPINLETLVNPTERQREFLQAIADKDFVLYGGEAGGGKSYILRWWLVLYLCKVFHELRLRNVVVGLFCEDYPTLNDRQVSKIKYEFPPWLGTLREGNVRNFVLHQKFGGGILALRNLDDPSKYYSAEFAAVAVDELTRNPKQIFEDLRFRLRWPGIQRPKFGAGTNPGGIGHAWVKKYWVTREYPDELQSIQDQFVLVKAKASDNPHLPANYHNRLLTLPPDMARKVAHGDWDVYTGQFFSNFTEEAVVTKEQAFAQIKPWHVRWVSGDWGYHHPHTIHWHSKGDDDQILTYSELWDTEVGETELGERIADMERTNKQQLGKCQPLTDFPFSWDAFGKLSPRSTHKIRKSIVEMIGDALPKEFPKPRPADSSPGSRISGWRLMSGLLNADMWKIADSCPKLIQCLPTLIREEGNEEDVLKVDYSENEIGDDPADSARMGIQNMLLANGKPIEVRVRDRVEAVAVTQGLTTDTLEPTSRAMLIRRAMGMEKNKGNGIRYARGRHRWPGRVN